MAQSKEWLEGYLRALDDYARRETCFRSGRIQRRWVVGSQGMSLDLAVKKAKAQFAGKTTTENTENTEKADNNPEEVCDANHRRQASSASR